MIFPDLVGLNDDELSDEIQARANVLENIKRRIRELPPSFERTAAIERKPIARENLRDALNEQSRRDHDRLNRL